MSLDSGWLNIVRLRPRVLFSSASALLIGFGILCWLKFPDAFQVIALLLGLVFAGFWISSLMQDEPKAEARLSQDIRAEKRIIEERLDSLSANEWKLLKFALDKNSQTIYTSSPDSSATSLMGKGLIIAPPGEFNWHEEPFIIRDQVWKLLKDNKAKYLKIA
jgi:hypothetical protein